MIVYRVELPLSLVTFNSRDERVGEVKNMGPYGNHGYVDREVTRWMCEHGYTTDPSFTSLNELHPTPRKDVGLRNAFNENSLDIEQEIRRHDLFYGFGSIEQLDKWFPFKLRNELTSYGYIVSVYECNTVYVGDSQAMFDLRNATLLRFIPLQDIVL